MTNLRAGAQIEASDLFHDPEGVDEALDHLVSLALEEMRTGDPRGPMAEALAAATEYTAVHPGPKSAALRTLSAAMHHASQDPDRHGAMSDAFNLLAAEGLYHRVIAAFLEDHPETQPTRLVDRPGETHTH